MKKKRGEQSAAYFANISKNVLKVQKLHHVRMDHTNQVIHEITEREPSCITIEDLNVNGIYTHMSIF